MGHNYIKLNILALVFLFVYTKANGQTYNMPNGTVSTCSGTFYDPGGTGNYGTSITRTFTICPSTPGSYASVTFSQFNVARDLLFGDDLLYVYDGNSTSAPIIDIYTGTVNPGTITASSSNTSGCLTFQFVSNWITTAAGWTATISCVTTPPTSFFCGGIVEYPFCTGTTYNYPNTVGTTGPGSIDYDCLLTWPNPKFFYMQIATSGTFAMQIRQTTGPNNTGVGLDVDFAMWGPFSSLTQGCTSVAGGAAPIQSSYDIQSIETVGIGLGGGVNCGTGAGQSTPPAAVAGQYYVVVITNYSDVAGYITFTQTGGSGTTDCSIISPCSISAVTATPTNCNASNQYSVSGTVSVTGGPSTGNLVITNSCGGSQTIAATGATSYNYNITGIAAPTSAGTCTITAQFSANTSCSNTRTYSPPVRPAANAGADVGLSCATSTATIGTSAIAGNTYAWSPALGLSSSTIAQPTANIASTYTVTVTNTANSCTNTDAVIVSNTATFPTANAGADQILTCTNTSFVIGTAAVAGNTYAWSPSAGLSSNNIAQPNATATGTYTLTVTNTANGCTATDAVTISQNITPPVANAGVDKTLTCATTSVSVGAAAVVGNTYAWSPAAGLSANNIAQPNATAPNTYTLTVTNTANGCTATDAVTISQNITPPVANAGTDQTLTCTTTSVSVGTAAVVGNTYVWSPAAGLSANNIAQPNATTPNTYTLTVTNTANGCTATDAVTISQNITPPVANAGVDKTLSCTNPSLVIGTTAVAGNSYAWSPVAGLSNAAIAQPNATVPNTYTLTVTNIANGCTATDAVTISQNITPPVANAGVDKTLTCTTTSVSIGAAAVAGNTYSWSPAAGLSANNIAQPNATAPNTYTLTVTNTANGCTATDA